MAIISPVSPKKLREIERSFPEGTIYSIYSLNLRFLFELDSQKDLQQKIDNIKLKSKIITWIKAKYLQIQFEKKCSKDKTKLPEERKESILKNSIFTEKDKEKKLEKIIEKFEKKLLKSEHKAELAGNFVKELVNLKGEIFYTNFQKSEHSVDTLKASINKLLGILNRYEHLFRNLTESKKGNEDQIEGVKKRLYKAEILKIKEIFKQKSENYSELENPDSIKDEKNGFLKKLDDWHEEINEEKRGYQKELYSEIREAEKFLASDIFGLFAKDPFFKISKDEKRIIKIDGKECRLIDVSKDEKKLLEDGHEFSIFRGNLKNKWLNALTYKVTTKATETKPSASYFIRLSKLGLLQIRKEEHLGLNYEGKPSGEISGDFKKILTSYQSNNYLPAKGELNEASFERMFPDSFDLDTQDNNDAVMDECRIRNAQAFLKNQNFDKNLIDVLLKLLNSQNRYSKTNKKTEIADDILEVAVGFAKLLEFKTNSNYSKHFSEQKISPVSLENVKKRRSELERQKYTLLFFTDLKKDKNSDGSFSPSYLDKELPGVVSCILQGSLESAEEREGIKILQYYYNKEGYCKIDESGNLCKPTLTAMRKSLNSSRKKCANKEGKEEIRRHTKSIKAYLKNPQGERAINNLKEALDYELREIFVIPNYSGSKEDNYKDLSTWENELCVFSPERGFIFFNDKKTLESGNKTVSYNDYWRCIVRGIEYTVALRATLQLLEARTTHLLDSIPEILNLSTPEKAPKDKIEIRKERETREKENKKKSEKGEESLKELTEDLASILKTLPGLRSIAIPTNAFRSGHSVKKFRYLYNNCFDFEEIIKNIQKNIDELTDFLTFFKQQQLQVAIDEGSKSEGEADRKLSKIAVIFTVASMIYIYVSFSQDFTSFFDFSTYFNSGNSEAVRSANNLSLFIAIIGKLLVSLVYLLIFSGVWTAINLIEPQSKFKNKVKEIRNEMLKKPGIVLLTTVIFILALIYVYLLIDNSWHIFESFIKPILHNKQRFIIF